MLFTSGYTQEVIESNVTAVPNLSAAVSAIRAGGRSCGTVAGVTSAPVEPASSRAFSSKARAHDMSFRVNAADATLRMSA